MENPDNQEFFLLFMRILGMIQIYMEILEIVDITRKVGCKCSTSWVAPLMAVVKCALYGFKCLKLKEDVVQQRNLKHDVYIV